MTRVTAIGLYHGLFRGFGGCYEDGDGVDVRVCVCVFRTVCSITYML